VRRALGLWVALQQPLCMYCVCVGWKRWYASLKRWLVLGFGVAKKSSATATMELGEMLWRRRKLWEPLTSEHDPKHATFLVESKEYIPLSAATLTNTYISPPPPLTTPLRSTPPRHQHPPSHYPPWQTKRPSRRRCRTSSIKSHLNGSSSAARVVSAKQPPPARWPSKWPRPVNLSCSSPPTPHTTSAMPSVSSSARTLARCLVSTTWPPWRSTPTALSRT